MTMKPRKIIQLTTAAVATPDYDTFILTALCDDGTVWHRELGPNGYWSQVSPIPQPAFDLKRSKLDKQPSKRRAR